MPSVFGCAPSLHNTPVCLFEFISDGVEGGNDGFALPVLDGAGGVADAEDLEEF